MMETIRVNMTPCEDIKTIHASQNDNEAREWGFELHNNGDKINSSSISDQLVFKAYEGGTEEILPTNGSTPTTSPFLGDIRYPQGLLSDQEFLYRESPAEEDGLANIVDIKGQTIKWNQQSKLAQNWTMNYGGATVTRGDDEITVSNVLANYYAYQGTGMKPQNGHVILVTCYAKANNGECGLYTNFGNVVFPKTSSSTYQLLSVINKETRSSATNYDYNIQLRVSMNSDSVSFKNPQIFDLTLMFGDTKAEEIYQMEQTTTGSGLAYFKQFFPLDYYPYNSGSLLSFNGNGIKTVGKNLLDANIGIAYGGGSGMRWYDSQGFMLMANKTYTFSASNTGEASVAVYIIDHATRTALASSSLVTTYTPTQNVIVYLQAYRGSGIPSETEFQLEFGSQTAYEPYTESVINLPISTYFPNGMDGVGSEYDELTNTKAYHRMARVDLGTLNWSYNANYGFISTSLSGVIKGEETYSAIGDIACAKYTTNVTAVSLR